MAVIEKTDYLHIIEDICVQINHSGYQENRIPNVVEKTRDFFRCFGVNVSNIEIAEIISGLGEGVRGFIYIDMSETVPKLVFEEDWPWTLNTRRVLNFYVDNDYTEWNEFFNNRCDTILFESLEMYQVFIKYADRFGYRWGSGDSLIDQQIDIDPGRTYITVNNREAMWGYIYDGGDIALAQELMFGIKESLLHPDDKHSIPLENLVVNRIYVVKRPGPGSYASSDTRVVFKYIGRNSPFYPYMRGDRVVDSSILLHTRYKIYDATEEEKQKFRPLYREYKIREAEAKEAQRRDKYLMELHTQYNRVVKHQLLSDSLHEIMFKAVDNPIAERLMVLNKLGYDDKSTRNITIRRDQAMSYMPLGKETVMTDDGNWEKKSRQEGKYGKILRKVLKEQERTLMEEGKTFSFTDHDLEKLVNHLKAETYLGDFREVKGDDIRYWYNGENYADTEEFNTGTLDCSCMRSEDCQDFFGIYTDNPDVCSMVILVKDDMLHGRALLWEANGKKWMDRIYGSDATITAFKSYAKERGYNHKSEQSSGNIDRWTSPDGKEFTETFDIKLQTDFSLYPYADTFFILDKDEGIISNDYGRDHHLEMRSTEGYLEGDELMVYDDYDECNIHEDDSIYLEYRNIYTHIDNTFHCEISGEYYLCDDSVILHSGERVWEEAEGVVYAGGDQVYAMLEDTYECQHSHDTYVHSISPSRYLEGLDIDVMEDYIDDAYKDNGYEFNEETESWELIKTEEKQTAE